MNESETACYRRCCEIVSGHKGILWNSERFVSQSIQWACHKTVKFEIGFTADCPAYFARVPFEDGFLHCSGETMQELMMSVVECLNPNEVPA